MEEIDEGRWKSYQVLDTYFTVPKRYQLESVVGRGQYGTVCRAVDKCDNDTEMNVAIKKIAVPNTGRVELPELRRVVREVALLKHFHHENIIALLDAFIAPTLTTEKNTEDVYLVTELLDVDLAGLLKHHRALSLEHIRYFGSQLLKAMAHIHESGIMHRDLKPSNIVVNAECDLKIVDFGLARVLDGDEMTEYVVTRYYRAPELLLESSNYTPAIDMWSVGCILAEMASGNILIPGTDIRGQVISILKTTGKPSPASIDKISSEKAREFVRSQPDYPPKDLVGFIRTEREKRGKEMDDFGELVDLISKLLVFSSEDRLTAKQALLHQLWTVDDDEEEEEEEVEEHEENVANGAPRPSPLLQINVERKTAQELRTLLSDMVGEFPSEKMKAEAGNQIPKKVGEASQKLTENEPDPSNTQEQPAEPAEETPAGEPLPPSEDEADRELLEHETYYPI